MVAVPVEKNLLRGGEDRSRICGASSTSGTTTTTPAIESERKHGHDVSLK